MMIIIRCNRSFVRLFLLNATTIDFWICEEATLVGHDIFLSHYFDCHTSWTRISCNYFNVMVGEYSIVFRRRWTRAYIYRLYISHIRIVNVRWERCHAGFGTYPKQLLWPAYSKFMHQCFAVTVCVAHSDGGKYQAFFIDDRHRSTHWPLQKY